ncbi:unnamed protein product, partial [Adineta ricciae]
VIPVTLNTWIHAAFVYDRSTSIQMIYFNGVLDNTRTPSSTLKGTATGITIGYIPVAASRSSDLNYFQGYMDQMTVSNRVKSSCEILEIATLVAYFTFDNGLFLNDSGPNSLNAAITQSTSSISTGRYSEAISFDGSYSSYFQAYGFTALGKSNKPFSISLWIRPISLQGVLVHVSSNITGLGWCMPFLAFTSNNSITAQIYNGSSVTFSVDPTKSVSISVWSHIVQTWSSSNGIRLYINNILVASSLSSAITYVASESINYITLGNSFNSTSSCFTGQANTMPYKGDMDDFRIYSRELSANDVCTLYSR